MSTVKKSFEPDINQLKYIKHAQIVMIYFYSEKNMIFIIFEKIRSISKY